jgi:hypothetical protein
MALILTQRLINRAFSVNHFAIKLFCHNHWSWVFGVFLFALAVTASAQSITGSLSGSVTDSTGAVVLSARVEIRSESTNVVRVVTTDDQGFYTAPELRPDVYTVTISASGFKVSVSSSVRIQVATPTVLNIQLQPGVLTETVTIIGGTEQIDLRTAEIGGVVTGQTTRDLPLNGRDFAQLTRLLAGATVDSEGGTGAFVVNGQRSSSNNFLVDGTDANHPILQLNATGPSGTSAAFASVEAIQEFRVQTHTYTAEFGRFSGAVVNVVTRSGSNEFHGSLFEFFRNDVLDANNFFLNAADQERPPLRSNQFGGTFSGPIIKDHTFVFGLYEGLRQRLSSVANGTVPSLYARRMADPGIRPVMDQIVLPTGPPLAPPSPNNPLSLLAPFTGSTPSSITENDVTFRVDHHFRDADQFFGRYSLGNGARRFASSAAALPPNIVEDTDIRLQSLTLSHTHLFSATIINDFRFGFSRINNSQINRVLPLFGAIPAQREDGIPTLPLVIVSDETLNNNIVGGTVGPAGDMYNTFHYIDTLSLLKSRHAVKVGADIRRVQYNRFSFRDNGGDTGVLVFPSTEAFVLNAPQAFVNQVGHRHRGLRFSNFSFYGQDEFHVKPPLTLNVGLRYELNTVLSEVNGLLTNVFKTSDGGFLSTSLSSPPYRGDHNNFAPRVGFALAPVASQKFVVRGGFGVYYDLVTQITTNLLANPPLTRTNAVFLPGPYPDLLAQLPSDPSNEPPFGAATGVPPEIRTPYSFQYNLNLQYELTQDTLVQVGYVGSRGIKLLRARVVNFLLPFGPLPGPVTDRRDPRYDLIQVNEASSQSVYHGLQVTVNRRMSRGLQFLANYTWSHSVDDASTLGLFGTTISGARSVSPFPSNPNEVSAERGNSNFDVRHVFTLSYTWDVPLGAERVSSAAKASDSPFSAFGSTLLAGWAISGVTSIRSGQPFTVALGFDNAALGDPTPFFSQRPNRVPGEPLTLGPPRGPDLRLNPAAFAVPPFGQFGNLGRNVLRGPNFSQFDLSILKTTKLGEGVSLQFRAEFYNIFNHPNFALPTETANLGVALNSPETFGVSTSTVNSQNQQLGAIFAPGGPRNIQFGIKLVY